MVLRRSRGSRRKRSSSRSRGKWGRRSLKAGEEEEEFIWNLERARRFLTRSEHSSIKDSVVVFRYRLAAAAAAPPPPPLAYHRLLRGAADLLSKNLISKLFNIS
jgi:hypothetical protein